MDPNRTIEIVLNGLLAGGGLAGLIAAWSAYKSRQRGEPGNETAAIVQANQPDWAALNSFWHREIQAKAKEVERVRRALEQQLEAERMAARARARADAVYIDALEAHIWQKLPPPPPIRKDES